MTRIVLFTGSELRHDYVRLRLASTPGVEVVCSYCEGQEASLRTLATEKGGADLELRHLAAREQSERDFFALYVATVEDRSRPRFIAKGAVNDADVARQVERLAPDLLVAYGCSLVREPLLSLGRGRFLNVHLGLSPHYRGAGTNFWPFVNGEPEYVGLTFMHIDAGVDTGSIIHQVRPRIYAGDGFHQIGNRLILDLPGHYASVITNFAALTPQPQPQVSSGGRLYRARDFTDDAVRALQQQLRAGLIERYLDEREVRCARVPLVVDPLISIPLAPASAQAARTEATIACAP